VPLVVKVVHFGADLLDEEFVGMVAVGDMNPEGIHTGLEGSHLGVVLQDEELKSVVLWAPQ